MRLMDVCITWTNQAGLWARSTQKKDIVAQHKMQTWGPWFLTPYPSCGMVYCWSLVINLDIHTKKKSLIVHVIVHCVLWAPLWAFNHATVVIVFWSLALDHSIHKIVKSLAKCFVVDTPIEVLMWQERPPKVRLSERYWYKLASAH